MNFQFYIEKLHDSEEYKKFVKEYADSYFCSAFVVLDKQANDNKIHIDYFVPGQEEIFSFELENKCRKVKVERYDKIVPLKIDKDIDFDMDEVEKLIYDKIDKEQIKNKVQKIILSLQNYKGQAMLTGTVFISMLGMLKINIDVDKMKIILFEKKNLFDMVKIVKKDKKDKKNKENKEKKD